MNYTHGSLLTNRRCCAVLVDGGQSTRIATTDRRPTLPKGILMKIAWLAASVLALAATAPASAAITAYSVVLSGAAESPPNASPATGSANVTFDSVLNTMALDVVFAGLMAGTTAAHIHCCTALPGAGTAGVATTTPTFPGFPLSVTSGTYNHLFDMTLASSYNPAFITAHGGTPASAFFDLLAGAETGKAYLNIHTTDFAGGEIRGFLMPIPEPETYALMLAGLAFTGWAARRRKA